MGSTRVLEPTRLRTWAYLLSGASAPVAAAAAGVLAWALRPSLPVALVVAGAVGAIARWLPEVLAGPERARRAVYHGLFPALVLGSFVLTARLWGEGWLAAAVSLAGAWGLGVHLRRRLFPGVFLQEEVERRRGLEELLA